MRRIILFSVIIYCFGCQPSAYYELYKTKSDNQLTQNQNTFVYENDSLLIQYAFWSNKGIMAFSVYNKSNKPIYIDWKKSNFIFNNRKYDYWVDSEIQKSSSTTSVVHNDILSIPFLTTSNVAIIKPERVTFIPPRSLIVKADHKILSESYSDWSSNFKTKTVETDDLFRNNAKVKYKEFNNSNTPVVFRNYLTFAYDEDLKSDFSIDHNFYVNEIQLIKSSHFVKDSTDAKWRTIRSYKIKGGTDFFILQK